MERLLSKRRGPLRSRGRCMRVSEAEVATELSLLKKQLPGEALSEAALDRLGVTASDLKTQLRKGIAIQKFIGRDFGANMSVSDNDVDLYYQAHPGEFMEPTRLRVSHILVRIDPSWNVEAKEEGRARIEAARESLIAGEAFALVARENSDCFSVKRGGDLGYFLPGQLSKRMEDEARALKPGGVSGIVEESYGLHLVEVYRTAAGLEGPVGERQERNMPGPHREKKLKVPAPFQKRVRAEAKVETLLHEDEL
jgi:peptidyl-prolyl cis-trans isomerase C